MTALKILYRMAIFSEVVTLNSMSCAAEQLGISKSVVSRNIKWLEEELNLSLLTRTRQSVTLTEAGRNYFRKCAPILVNAHKLKDEVFGENNEMAGEIILSCPFALYQPLIPPLVDSFIKRYPQVKFNLSYSAPGNEMYLNELDIYLHLGPLENSNLYAKKIANFKFGCIASATYLENSAQSVDTLNDIRDLNWIVHAVKGQVKDITTTTPAGESVTFTPLGNIKTNFGNDKLDFVSNNLGVAVLPLLNIQDKINSGELVQLLPDHQWMTLDMHAVYSYKDLPLRVRKFIEHLSEHVPEYLPKTHH